MQGAKLLSITLNALMPKTFITAKTGRMTSASLPVVGAALN